MSGEVLGGYRPDLEAQSSPDDLIETNEANKIADFLSGFGLTEVGVDNLGSSEKSRQAFVALLDEFMNGLSKKAWGIPLKDHQVLKPEYQAELLAALSPEEQTVLNQLRQWQVTQGKQAGRLRAYHQILVNYCLEFGRQPSLNQSVEGKSALDHNESHLPTEVEPGTSNLTISDTTPLEEL